MPTLYRKYRPQTFTDIVGQEHIVQTITNEIKMGTPAHAYLFSGPRGVGKTTAARLLAKAVNCEKRKKEEFEPCDNCNNCYEVKAGRSLDVIEIDAASHTGVDNVRENIIDNAQFRPSKSDYKVFIIDEVHMLSTSAFNALLKILEEPPEHVLFVLATTELHKLPATVVSRCQRFNFKKIPYDLMLTRLTKLAKSENKEIEKEVLERIINKSDGALRDAESLLNQVLNLEKERITVADVAIILPTANAESLLKFVSSLINKQAKPALELIQILVENGTNLDQFTLYLLELERTIMVMQAGATVRGLSNYSTEAVKEINKLATQISAVELTILIDKTLKRKQEIKTSPLAQLPLELLVIESCYSKRREEIEKPLKPPLTAPVSGLDNVESKTTSTILSTLATTPAIAKTIADKGRHAFGGKKLTAKKISGKIKKAISTISHKPPKATLAQIKSKWGEAINTLPPSLAFILKATSLQKVDGAGLHISVTFDLHKEKLEEKKSKKAIEDTLQNIFGEPIRIVCTMAASTPPKDTELERVAAEFGGEVVA